MNAKNASVVLARFSTNESFLAWDVLDIQEGKKLFGARKGYLMCCETEPKLQVPVLPFWPPLLEKELAFPCHSLVYSNSWSVSETVRDIQRSLYHFDIVVPEIRHHRGIE